MDLIERFNYEKENQKHGLTSLDIFAPDALEKEFKQHIVFSNENAFAHGGWAKFDKINVPMGKLEKLKINFQREKGDIIPTGKEPETYFMLFSSLCGPKMKKTKLYKYTGFVQVTNGGIDLVWIHPFYRNLGIMQTFLIGYALNEGPLFLQLPVSKAMKACIDKVEMFILSNGESLTQARKMQIAFLNRKFPNAKIDESNLAEAMNALEYFRVNIDGESKNISIETFMEIAMRGLDYLNKHPEKETIMKQIVAACG